MMIFIRTIWRDPARESSYSPRELLFVIRTGFPSVCPVLDDPNERCRAWGMFSSRFGDFDEDGDLDVVSTGFGGAEGGLQVYLNEMDGSWLRGFGFLWGNTDNSLAVGDVDNDGHLDVVAGKEQGTVWLGDGEGFFTVSDEGLPLFDEYCNKRGVAMGDLNRDGRDDIAFCHCYLNNSYVYLRREDGTWQNASAAVPDTDTCDYTGIADMDGDGSDDLVIFGKGWVYVYRGDGTRDGAADGRGNPGTGLLFQHATQQPSLQPLTSVAPARSVGSGDQLSLQKRSQAWHPFRLDIPLLRLCPAYESRPTCRFILEPCTHAASSSATLASSRIPTYSSDNRPFTATCSCRLSPRAISLE